MPKAERHTHVAVPSPGGFSYAGEAAHYLSDDLVDRRKGTYDNVVPPSAEPLKEHSTPHEREQTGGAVQPEVAPPDESTPEGLKRKRKGPYGPTRGR